jgi:hypothetical protein
MLALGIAAAVIPTAKVPEPDDIGRILPADRDHARDVFMDCGGGTPFLVHEHRDGDKSSMLELYPRGEWKRTTGSNVGEMSIGCVDVNALEQIHELLDRATWKREPGRSCDVAMNFVDKWQVDSVEMLTYGPCDATQPDRLTENTILAISDFEAGLPPPRVAPATNCGPDALACYETDQLFPEIRFVVQTSGQWELTHRDPESNLIIDRRVGTVPSKELAVLATLVARAPWKLLPWNHSCEDIVYDAVTVSALGKSVTWSSCGDEHPDPESQMAIDQLFALYREALQRDKMGN